VVGLTARHVDLEKVDRFGHRVETERFVLSDVTQIGFGNGYLDVLALLVSHESRTNLPGFRSGVRMR